MAVNHGQYGRHRYVVFFYSQIVMSFPDIYVEIYMCSVAEFVSCSILYVELFIHVYMHSHACIHMYPNLQKNAELPSLPIRREISRFLIK